MKLFGLFNKLPSLPHSLTFEGSALDYTHIYYTAPNPEVQRDNTITIHGLSHITKSKSPLIPNEFNDIIYMPYPIGSLLSDYDREYSKKPLYYHTSIDFEIDDSFMLDKTFLHLIRIYGEYIIYLNGTKLSFGYDAYDLTLNVNDILKVGQNRLIITIKENIKEPVIGVSGPIYLESSLKNRIESVKVEQGKDRETIIFYIDSIKPEGKIQITTPTSNVYTYDFITSRVEVKLENIIEWDPSKPFFYQYVVKLNDGDTLRGIFALFNYSIGNIDSIDCLTLNNKPYPIKGIIDDYYYSDSLTIPSTQAFSKFKFSEVKSLGFNTIRKTSFIEIPDYYYNGLVKGLLIAQDIISKDIESLDKIINYLNKFKAIFLINIILNKKMDNMEELYKHIKDIVKEKLVVITYKNNSYGDIKLTKNKKEPYILSLKFDNKIDGLKEFMDREYISNSMNEMIGFFYHSLNNPKDGLYNDSMTKIRYKKNIIKDIIKS